MSERLALLTRRTFGETTATFRVLAQDSQHARLIVDLPHGADFYARAFVSRERATLLEELRQRFAHVTDQCFVTVGAKRRRQP